ncbi:MAG TPA: inorganic phosphate transporter [Candidatus Thermoplasmatota archaeon]|nr:inorganic phosphate transporter [Candidatus Thermoplasmatota archaeon]
MIDWMSLGPLVLLTIFVALVFDFYNGLHDAANSIATVVATKALPVWAALLLAGVANFIGAFGGTAVAATIGAGIIAAKAITTTVVLAALVGAIFWSVLTVILGIPISSSQSLVGGLIGAALASAGLSGIQAPHPGELQTLGIILAKGAVEGAVAGLILGTLMRASWRSSLLVGAGIGSAANLVWAFLVQHYAPNKLMVTILFIAYSPFIGFVMAFLFTAIISWGFRKAGPGQVKHLFRFLQIGSSTFYSIQHGKNDAQKTMGVITAVLLAVGAITVQGKVDIKHFPVPNEVIIACGLAISLGTLIGGRKIVRTMGTRLTALDTSQGFAAETSSAIGLYYLAEYGVPVSTTHSITGSILGVGAYKRASAVSWGTARRIVTAWVITIPAAALVAALTYFVLDAFL